MTATTEVVGDDERAAAEPAYGFPAPLWRTLERLRPPGPLFRASVFTSPVRGPWLTSVFASVLLVGLPLLTITGLLSYAAYEPRFAGNPFPADPGILRLPYFPWPAGPSWLYHSNPCHGNYTRARAHEDETEPQARRYARRRQRYL